MPKQKGIIKLQGTIGDFTFYTRNGKDWVRAKTSLDKHRVDTDPSFLRTRESNQEFAGAAFAGKMIRQSLIRQFKEMTDSNLTARMLRLCKEIICREEGIRGQRPFLPALHRSAFVNFKFSIHANVDNIFHPPYITTVNEGRTEATLLIPDFNAGKHVSAPSGATHFRILHMISAVSAYRYDLDSKKYLPSDETANGKNKYEASSYHAVTGETGGTIKIVVSLDPTIKLSATTALFSCIGIQFYQQRGEEFCELASGSAMKIQAVF